MYTDTIDQFIEAAVKKTQLLRTQPLAFFMGSLAAGAYVGLGILLIFSVGAALPASVQKLVMGLTFAIALILVIIAGAELFTGYTMYMTLGRLAGRVSWSDLMYTWIACWVGNLLGSMLVAALFAIGGANGLLNDPKSLVYTVADYKMHGSIPALVARGILCNWLVCLALWMSARVRGDVAKCIVTFWCLLAFITSGYEHSVANMTLFSLAVIGRQGDIATISGAFYNLGWVTLGNTIAGALMVAMLYWFADRRRLRSSAAQPTPVPTASAASVHRH